MSIVDLGFFFKIFFFTILLIAYIEFTLLLDKKISLDWSFLILFKILIVPIRLVSITLFISFLETSTAASAQQSIIRSNFGNKDIFLELVMSIL